jgi:hypothetical protein
MADLEDEPPARSRGPVGQRLDMEALVGYILLGGVLLSVLFTGFVFAVLASSLFLR